MADVPFGRAADHLEARGLDAAQVASAVPHMWCGLPVSGHPPWCGGTPDQADAMPSLRKASIVQGGTVRRLRAREWREGLVAGADARVRFLSVVVVPHGGAGRAAPLPCVSATARRVLRFLGGWGRLCYRILEFRAIPPMPRTLLDKDDIRLGVSSPGLHPVLMALELRGIRAIERPRFL
jgi:hypothetical protein